MAPLHRVRFVWDADRQIEIEAAKGCGVMLAVPPIMEPTVELVESEAEPDDRAKRGIPAMCWRDDVPPLFERFQLRENTDYFVDITLPIAKDAAAGHAAVNRAWPFTERLGTVFVRDPPRRWKETDAGNVVVSGQLRLKNHAGVLDLRTPFDMPLLAEVVCSKLNYIDEFQTLLNEVAEQLAELLLQYDSPLSVTFDASDNDPENDAALLFQMRHIMNPQNLPIAVDEVLESFHARLVEHTVLETMSSVSNVEPSIVVDELDTSVLERGGPLARLFRGFTPREIAETERFETFDTLENRYVKNFLEECLLLAERLAQRLGDRRKPAAMREAQEWMTQLAEMLGHRAWATVGPLRQFPSNSQVLQKRRGYREILKFDLSLRLGLKLSWRRGDDFAEGLLGDVRPVNEIYEYWCFFVLRRLLAQLCETELPGDGSFLSIAADGLQVRLEKGKRSRVSFIYKADSTRRLQICLFYNRRFKRPSRPIQTWDGSYTAFFDPDYSILATMNEGGATRRHWLHFDAKYRLEVAEVAALFSAAEPAAVNQNEDEGTVYDHELARIHKQDDLFKMHTYRDGILSSRGAYILFPGDRAELRVSGNRQNLFVRHPTAFGGTPVHQFPSVGAFDLCPGRDGSQSNVIRKFLLEIFEAIFANEPYAEEIGLF